jgi:hypothetical protein
VSGYYVRADAATRPLIQPNDESWVAEAVAAVDAALDDGGDRTGFSVKMPDGQTLRDMAAVTKGLNRKRNLRPSADDDDEPRQTKRAREQGATDCKTETARETLADMAAIATQFTPSNDAPPLPPPPAMF